MSECDRPSKLTRGVNLSALISANMAEMMHKVTIYQPPGRSWNVADDSGFASRFVHAIYSLTFADRCYPDSKKLSLELSGLPEALVDFLEVSFMVRKPHHIDKFACSVFKLYTVVHRLEITDKQKVCSR